MFCAFIVHMTRGRFNVINVLAQGARYLLLIPLVCCLAPAPAPTISGIAKSRLLLIPFPLR
jgi:hypothetical protein